MHLLRAVSLASVSAVASLGFVLTASADHGFAPVTPQDHSRGPSTARVVVLEYGDFECPFCKRHHPTMKFLLEAYPKDVRWVYRHFPLSFHADAMPAAVASECVAKLGGNDAFWIFADLLYEQDELPENFGALALKAGVKQHSFADCLEEFGPDFQTAIEEGMTDASHTVGGTPTTLIINAKQGALFATIAGAVEIGQFTSQIDELLADARNGGTRQPPAPSKPLPTPANPVKLAPFAPVSTTEAVRGSKDAEITIVQYGDLEDPFTRRAHADLKKLVRVSRGKVNWVFRHFPLSFHLNAMSAAQTAECLREMGGGSAYWSFVDALLSKQSLDQETIDMVARRWKINDKRLSQCVASKRIAKRIALSYDRGVAAGVQGTPHFFFVNNRTKETETILGAMPYQTFKDTIDRLLGE